MKIVQNIVNTFFLYRIILQTHNLKLKFLFYFKFIEKYTYVCGQSFYIFVIRFYNWCCC